MKEAWPSKICTSSLREKLKVGLILSRLELASVSRSSVFFIGCSLSLINADTDPCRVNLNSPCCVGLSSRLPPFPMVRWRSLPCVLEQSERVFWAMWLLFLSRVMAHSWWQVAFSVQCSPRQPLIAFIFILTSSYSLTIPLPIKARQLGRSEFIGNSLSLSAINSWYLPLLLILIMNAQTNSNPQKCLACHTFYGSDACKGYCSSCYKKCCQSDQTSIQSKAPSQNGASQEPAAAVQQNRNRCFGCNKKLGLLGVECKCGYVFCNGHRMPEDHECKFDHESAGRQKLQKDMVKMEHNKIRIL